MLRLHPILIVAVTALLPVENAAAQSYTIPSEPANPTSDAQCNSMGEQFRTIREMLLEEARKLGDQAWEIAKKTTLDSYTAAKPYYDEAKQNRDAANSILTRASKAHRECLRKVRANKSASDEDIDNIFNQVGDLADEANPGNTYGQSLSGAMFDASMNELSEHYKDLFQRLDQMKADLAKVNSEIVAAATGSTSNVDYSSDLQWLEEETGGTNEASVNSTGDANIDYSSDLKWLESEVGDTEDVPVTDNVLLADNLMDDLKDWEVEQERQEQEQRQLERAQARMVADARRARMVADTQRRPASTGSAAIDGCIEVGNETMTYDRYITLTSRCSYDALVGICMVGGWFFFSHVWRGP